MPACPYIRRFVHPSARSFAGRPVCAAEALRRLCVATHRLRTAAGVCIVRRIASRPLHPPHCLPSAVSAAPRCIDAPFIPRRSVHSRAPSAALCLFRCIRRIASRPPCPPRPVASTLRSFPRPVRRIVSLPLHPPHCLPAAVSAAPRLPPANPARMRRAAGSGASAGTFGLFGLLASSPALRLFSRRSPMPLPCPRPHAPARRPPRPARNQK